MDTRSFTAALVALALLTGCSPNTTPNANSPPGTPGPGATGQGPAPQGQTSQAPGQGGGFSGPGGGAPGGGPPGAGARTGGRQAVVTVQTEDVKAGVLWVDNTTAGAVVPEIQSTVAAGSSGTVRTLLRQVGEWVEPGTPVIQLDDTQLKLSLRLAQATLDNAKINAGVADGGNGTGSKLGLQVLSAQSALASSQKNFASAQALAKVGGISGSDLDNAQTQLQNAQANLESAKMSLAQSGLQVETASIQLQQAQLNLANATIKAPYAGQISAINLHPGEFVGTSTAAFSLVSRTKVISFGISPSEAPGLSLGSPVSFRYGGKVAQTRITQAPSAPVNGMVPLTAALPASVDAPLGTVGSLSYRLAAAEGVLVPLPALQSAENKTFVFTADKGKARRFEVTVLGDSGTYTAVSGIPSGVTVILNPPPGLLVGASVQPLTQEGAVPVAGTPAAIPDQGTTLRKRPTGASAGAASPGTTPETTRGPAATGAPGGDLPQDQGANPRRRPAVGAEGATFPEGAGQAPGTGQRRRPADGGTPGAPTEPGATTPPTTGGQ